MLLVASDAALTSGVVIRVVSSGVVAAAVVTSVDVGQSSSSEDTPSSASPQSSVPSHTHVIGTHTLLRQVKLSVEQCSAMFSFTDVIFPKNEAPVT